HSSILFQIILNPTIRLFTSHTFLIFPYLPAPYTLQTSTYNYNLSYCPSMISINLYNLSNLHPTTLCKSREEIPLDFISISIDMILYTDNIMCKIEIIRF